MMRKITDLLKAISGIVMNITIQLRPRLILAGTTALVIISSCEMEVVTIEQEVDAPIQEYFNRFVDEGSSRGIDVAYATSQVKARISDISEPNVIGQCAWSQGHAHSITLDKKYWNGANDLQREFLVFHELGHCVLGRNHVDEADANGHCTSIMTSGKSQCRILYLAHNRKKLIDELFAN